MEKADSGTEKEKGGERIMSGATTEMKITEYDPLIIEKFVDSKQPIFITVTNATKDDIEYINKLLKNPNNIKQADLRDNMCLIKPDKDRGWCVILRSAKLEREYQDWQEEVRKKVEAKDKRNKEREGK